MTIVDQKPLQLCCERLSKHDYLVRDVPLHVAQDLVRRYHYAAGGSNTGVYCHGLFNRSFPFDCLGIAWWLPPTKSCAIASWDGLWQEVLSLSRLVIAPTVPKNAASFLLSHSVKLIKKDRRYKCLITYADTWQKHTGAIYRAANWEYVGLTKATECWLTAGGRMVSRKAGGTTRTSAQMKSLGHHLAGLYPKHKYRLILPALQPIKANYVQLELFSPTLNGGIFDYSDAAAAKHIKTGGQSLLGSKPYRLEFGSEISFTIPEASVS